MKKLCIIIAAAGLICSCGSNKQKDLEKDVQTVADVHNPQNSDYKGIYTGKLPAADGEGILISIELGDNTFVRKTEYLSMRHHVYEEHGNFTWNNAGNTIILQETDKEAPNQYLVGENTLTQLNMEGNEITGELANMYVLKKQ